MIRGEAAFYINMLLPFLFAPDSRPKLQRVSVPLQYLYVHLMQTVLTLPLKARKLYATNKEADRRTL